MLIPFILVSGDLYLYYIIDLVRMQNAGIAKKFDSYTENIRYNVSGPHCSYMCNIIILSEQCVCEHLFGVCVVRCD